MWHQVRRRHFGTKISLSRNCSGRAKQETPGGYINVEEVKLIADVIKYLLSHGVPGSCIVAIATYDAQAIAIRTQLKEIE